MTTSQWLGLGGLAVVFALGFWALWRGSNNRQDKIRTTGRALAAHRRIRAETGQNSDPCPLSFTKRLRLGARCGSAISSGRLASTGSIKSGPSLVTRLTAVETS